MTLTHHTTLVASNLSSCDALIGLDLHLAEVLA